MDNTANYNGLEFSYEDMIRENIDEDEYIKVYSNITILESRNKKIKKGDKIEQISIGITIHYENEDGSKFLKK